ncbi:MAG: hypothetical protein SGBAC_000777 [Bacillariaceae sp.]
MASIESVELADRFDRWLFLQRLLDLEVDNDVSNELLLRVLNNSLNRPKSDDPLDGNAEINSALRETITSVVTTEAEGPVEALNSVEVLENLLPDTDEDEDAVISLWDIVNEIHGREMTKIDEAEATAEWKLACVQTRVLLHFDFLTEGI